MWYLDLSIQTAIMVRVIRWSTKQKRKRKFLQSNTHTQTHSLHWVKSNDRMYYTPHSMNFISFMILWLLLPRWWWSQLFFPLLSFTLCMCVFHHFYSIKMVILLAGQQHDNNNNLMVTIANTIIITREIVWGKKTFNIE